MELWQIDWGKYNSTFCGVYVIAPSKDGPSKVGISQNLVARLSAMQTDHWLELSVHDYSYCGSSKEALLVEARAHEALKGDGKHLRGEWFNIQPMKAAEVVSFAANMLGIEMRREKPATLIKPPNKLKGRAVFRANRWAAVDGLG